MNLSEEEEEKPRPKRVKRKGVVKIFMPRLIDTTPGAFEKFKEEQRKKKEQQMREDKFNEQKIRKYFYDIEALQTYQDAEFDDFVREELEKYRIKKGKLKVGDFRLDNFMNEFIRNVEKDKLLKPKLNYLSPINFRKHDDLNTIDYTNLSRNVERNKSGKTIKSCECVNLMSNKELNKRYKSIEKAEQSLRRILQILNQEEFK